MNTKTAGDSQSYGVKDASFQAAGGELGIRQLVDDFYTIMDDDLAFDTIRQMHEEDLTTARDKLTLFLCGWLGGPRLYREKYGGISIPQVHAHLNISATERDQWLGCMQQAIVRQPFATEFAEYLLRQLGVPAERIRVVCSRHDQTGVLF